MPVYTSPHTWVTGESITATRLNAEGSALETFLNTTKLNSTNLQAGGVSNTNLASKYYVYTVSLSCAEGGTGTTRAIGDFQAYATVLDQVALLGSGTIIGMSVMGATDLAAAGQKVQLYLYHAAAETAIADSIVDVVSTGTAAEPNTAVLNTSYVSGDSIRVKMTGATGLDELPVRVTIWLKEALRS